MALASPLLEKEEQAYVAVGDHIAAQDIDGPRFPGCHGRRPLVVFGLATVLVIAASSNPFVVSGQLNQLSTVEGCDASLMESNALAFFWALNSGEDWKGTMPYVSDEQATFNAQVRRCRQSNLASALVAASAFTSIVPSCRVCVLRHSCAPPESAASPRR
jgi:hypothetical protein